MFLQFFYPIPHAKNQKYAKRSVFGPILAVFGLFWLKFEFSQKIWLRQFSALMVPRLHAKNPDKSVDRTIFLKNVLNHLQSNQTIQIQSIVQ